MAFDPHANFVSTVVTTPPSPPLSGNTLIVANGSVFPSQAGFNAIICLTQAAHAFAIAIQLGTAMKSIIEALKLAGVRDQVKVLIGGAPITQKYADEIGADGYSENAVGAVALAKKSVAAAV